MKSFSLSMLFAFLLLSRYNSDEGSNNSSNKDSPLQGVTYTCNTITGVTDQNGTFEY